MFTIKEYNQNQNKTYNPAENYKNWRPYRGELTDFICRNIKKGRTLIIGAGYSNDMELKDIIEVSSDLTLLDIDIDSVRTGLQIQNMDINNVSIVQKDITGLDKSLFFEKIAYLIAGSDFTGIQRYLNELKTSTLEIMPDSSFENIVISPIYTQLLLPQYLSLINDNLAFKDRNKALEPFMDFIGRLIENVNASIYSLLEKNGSIITVSDILEYRDDDSTLMLLRENIENHEYIEKHVESYIKEYGHGLGSYGLKDICDKTALTEEKWMIWDFIKGRSLLTKTVAGRRV